MESESASMLARLMAQAEAKGVELVTLRALVEEASQAGRRGRLARSGWMSRARGGTWMSCANFCRRGGMQRSRRGRPLSDGRCGLRWRCWCSGWR